MVRWQDYFRQCLDAFEFHPWQFDGEDMNLRAFRSKQAFADWFAQEPGPRGSPYRDEGFYVRELTNLSCKIKPLRIVEFGTSLGLGTLILRILNPIANMYTVDNRLTQFLPGNVEVETGFLAKREDVRPIFVTADSWTFAKRFVCLCFIDADHSYESVKKDSFCAWENRRVTSGAIAWHDYNERHPGVMQAVDEFCREKMVSLNKLDDSCTVWIDW